MRMVRDTAQRTGPTGERGLVRNIVGRTKDRLQMAANRAGWSVTRQVPIDRQAALLEAARPWQTEHPLIRVGGAGDGGYLLPDDLDGIAACFSPGVSNQATFEEDLLARGIPCFQADASVE